MSRFPFLCLLALLCLAAGAGAASPYASRDLCGESGDSAYYGVFAFAAGSHAYAVCSTGGLSASHNATRLVRAPLSSFASAPLAHVDLSGPSPALPVVSYVGLHNGTAALLVQEQLSDAFGDPQGFAWTRVDLVAWRVAARNVYPDAQLSALEALPTGAADDPSAPLLVGDGASFRALDPLAAAYVNGSAAAAVPRRVLHTVDGRGSAAGTSLGGVGFLRAANGSVRLGVYSAFEAVGVQGSSPSLSYAKDLPGYAFATWREGGGSVLVVTQRQAPPPPQGTVVLERRVWDVSRSPPAAGASLPPLTVPASLAASFENFGGYATARSSSSSPAFVASSTGVARVPAAGGRPDAFVRAAGGDVFGVPDAVEPPLPHVAAAPSGYWYVVLCQKGGTGGAPGAVCVLLL